MKQQSTKSTVRRRQAQVSEQAVVEPLHGDLALQHEYVKQMHGFGYDITVSIAAAFAKGMRRLGYRNTCTAIDELIDNAIQADAKKIVVCINKLESPAGVEREDLNQHANSGKKRKRQATRDIDAIAVVDDGHGMEADMIRLAMSWGGSHRTFFSDLSGFGRFGFGLPSAAVSQGTRYRVLSRINGNQPFTEVEIDLDALSRGDYTKGKRVQIPDHRVADPPPWVQRVLQTQFRGLPHGTVVVLECLDELSWNVKERLHEELVRHLGAYYRNFIDTTKLFVDETEVEKIDPLFLTENARYFAIDDDRAESVLDEVVPVGTPSGTVNVKVRCSYIPPTFPHKDKSMLKRTKSDLNARWNILRLYNKGVVVLRNGRQSTSCPHPGRPRSIATSIGG